MQIVFPVELTCNQSIYLRQSMYRINRPFLVFHISFSLAKQVAYTKNSK